MPLDPLTSNTTRIGDQKLTTSTGPLCPPRPLPRPLPPPPPPRETLVPPPREFISARPRPTRFLLSASTMDSSCSFRKQFGWLVVGLVVGCGGEGCDWEGCDVTTKLSLHDFLLPHYSNSYSYLHPSTSPPSRPPCFCQQLFSQLLPDKPAALSPTPTGTMAPSNKPTKKWM
jgi:hypothetical protein